MPKLSIEGTVGILFEISVVILEHLHIGEPLFIWGLFFVGFALVSDALLRSDWARAPKEKRQRIRRRVLEMLPVVVVFLAIGLFVRHRLQGLRRVRVL